MIDEIIYGSETIQYSLSFKNRKTLGITVHPDLAVEVRAPENSTIEKVRDKIKKKAAWILEQQSFFLSFHPRITERKFISGESHFYLGRQYVLKVIESDTERVEFSRGRIIVQVKKKEDAGRILKQWYRKRASIKFPEIAKPLIEKFQKHGVEPKSLQIHEMPFRWGSCTPKGKIILNPELIKAPKACIEYVVTHELCHLVVRNHSRAFFELQTEEMPDWKKWKEKLENLLA